MIKIITTDLSYELEPYAVNLDSTALVKQPDGTYRLAGGSTTTVVDSEAEMLALSAHAGDLAVRTDTEETYVLMNEPASILANWVLIASTGGGGGGIPESLATAANQGLYSTAASTWAVFSLTAIWRAFLGTVKAAWNETTGVFSTWGLQINTAPTTTPTSAPGLLVWDDTNGTIEFQLKGGNVSMHIGETQVVRIKNDSGGALAAGDVVYISGSNGVNLLTSLANASAESTSAGTIGIVAEPIAANNHGFVVTFGMVSNINTDHLVEGGPVWLATTAGDTTATRPTQPNHGVVLGFCLRKHATVGVIFVRVDNGWELDELHNVLISSVASGDVLVRNAGNTLWENKAQSTLSVGYATTAGSATTAGGAPPTGSAGGDLTGTYPNPTLAAIATAGSAGTASKSATVTIDAKGRVTSITDQDIAITKAQAGLSNVDNTADASKSVLYATTAGGAPPTGTAGGDLAGTYPNPTLAAVATAGTMGSATKSLTLTIDAKGRVTSMSENTITATDSTKLPLAGGTMTGTIVLRAGTSTAGTSPLKFVAGSPMSTTEAGALEFTTDDLLFTITTGTARKRLALCDAALTSGKIPVATTNGRLTDAAALYWDSANSRLGVGAATPAAALDVGVTRRFTVYPDYAGLGDIPANTALIGSYAANLAYFPETSAGGSGYKVIFGYYNGATVKSAIEYANTTASATSTLELMKGGGNVNVGASAAVAARNAVTIKNTSSSSAAEAGVYITSEVGNAFIGMTSNASSRSIAGLVIAAEGATYPIGFLIGTNRAMTINTSSQLGIGVNNATAMLHLKAGTLSSNTAPLKFNSGTLMGTAEAGAVEFLTDDLYFTITTGAARKRVALVDSSLTTGQGVYASTNGRLVNDRRYQIYATGTTAGTAGSSVQLVAAALATSGDFRWIKLTVKAKGANVPPAKFVRTLEAVWSNGTGTLSQTGSDVLGTAFSSGSLAGATIVSAASGTNVVITCTDVTGVGATVTWEIFGEYC